MSKIGIRKDNITDSPISIRESLLHLQVQSRYPPRKGHLYLENERVFKALSMLEDTGTAHLEPTYSLHSSYTSLAFTRDGHLNHPYNAILKPTSLRVYQRLK